MNTHEIRQTTSFLGLLVLLVPTYIAFRVFIIPGSVYMNSLHINEAVWNNLLLLLAPIAGYILLVLVVCLAVSMFRPPKDVLEDRLIWTVYFGFLGGIIFELFLGSLIAAFSGSLA